MSSQSERLIGVSRPSLDDYSDEYDVGGKSHDAYSVGEDDQRGYGDKDRTGGATGYAFDAEDDIEANGACVLFGSAARYGSLGARLCLTVRFLLSSGLLFVAASVMVGLASGTPNGFNGILTLMKENISLSDSQGDLVSSLGLVGLFFTIPAGFLIDRLGAFPSVIGGIVVGISWFRSWDVLCACVCVCVCVCMCVLHQWVVVALCLFIFSSSLCLPVCAHTVPFFVYRIGGDVVCRNLISLLRRLSYLVTHAHSHTHTHSLSLSHSSPFSGMWE
jgi:hypothetical protein